MTTVQFDVLLSLDRLLIPSRGSVFRVLAQPALLIPRSHKHLFLP